MTGKARLLGEHPNAYYLDADDRTGLTAYLSGHGWLTEGEQVASATAPGAGNMNYTLRLRLTSDRTVIVKQARPWVEKYPHIAAPWDRALVEGRFYTVTGLVPSLQALMPRLLGVDEGSRVLLLEDLGEGADFTPLYAGEPLVDADLAGLVGFLATLHTAFEAQPLDPIFDNRAMRALNHHHIFEFPLAPANGLDLDAITPGLGRVAATLGTDRAYGARVAALGAHYLEQGSTLVHGDYFPGSWLHTSAGCRVIDPEFCFAGPASFDLGVMVAHLLLAGGQPASRVHDVVARYQALRGGVWDERQHDRMLEYAGVEIMRRLVGVAQLPVVATLDQKRALLELSRELVLSPSSSRVGR